MRRRKIITLGDEKARIEAQLDALDPTAELPRSENRGFMLPHGQTMLSMLSGSRALTLIAGLARGDPAFAAQVFLKHLETAETARLSRLSAEPGWPVVWGLLKGTELELAKEYGRLLVRWGSRLSYAESSRDPLRYVLKERYCYIRRILVLLQWLKSSAEEAAVFEVVTERLSPERQAPSLVPFGALVLARGYRLLKDMVCCLKIYRQPWRRLVGGAEQSNVSDMSEQTVLKKSENLVGMLQTLYAFFNVGAWSDPDYGWSLVDAMIQCVPSCLLQLLQLNAQLGARQIMAFQQQWLRSTQGLMTALAPSDASKQPCAVQKQMVFHRKSSWIGSEEPQEGFQLYDAVSWLRRHISVWYGEITRFHADAHVREEPLLFYWQADQIDRNKLLALMLMVQPDAYQALLHFAANQPKYHCELDLLRQHYCDYGGEDNTFSRVISYARQRYGTFSLPWVRRRIDRLHKTFYQEGSHAASS